MRLIEPGALSPLRSQTTYHAIARALTPSAEPVLSLYWTDRPYVCTGFHRPLAELDLEECRRRGLSILRRQLGGGPVYLDADQLLFQVTLPADRAPAMVDAAYRVLLGPAVAAFRRLGIEAVLVGSNDICVAGRKLSGTGMARIGDALVCVGNVILDFDHDAMAAILALEPAMRRTFASVQRRYLTTLRHELGRVVPRDEARDAVVAAYAEAFGPLEPSALTADEERTRAELDVLFTSREWLFDEGSGWSDEVRQAKIRGGARVYTTQVERDGAELHATFAVVDGRLEDVAFASAALTAKLREGLAAAMVGLVAEREALLGAARAVMRAAVGPFGPEDVVDCVLRAERGRAT
ncbi:MAG: biotin/lipoate A/B protein ligase family protein [Chloroflexota bacterium]